MYCTRLLANRSTGSISTKQQYVSFSLKYGSEKAANPQKPSESLEGVWLEKSDTERRYLESEDYDSNKLIVEFFRINCVRDDSASQTLTQTQMILFCQFVFDFWNTICGK